MDTLSMSIGVSIIAVIYGLITISWINKQPAGSDKMREISDAIAEGAKAYLNRQYSTIGVVGGVLFIIITYFLGVPVGIGFLEVPNQQPAYLLLHRL
jgi:K(+)-stimulated pyrophosphate-energized sodium pump